jgi:hypothetical protein
LTAAHIVAWAMIIAAGTLVLAYITYVVFRLLPPSNPIRAPSKRRDLFQDGTQCADQTALAPWFLIGNCH